MKENEKIRLSLQLLKRFRVIYGSMRHHSREIESICGLSGSQLWVLQEIASCAGIGISELAERLSIHQSTCSQLVEKLVSVDLIIKDRSRDDLRRVGLRLTEVAEKLMKKMPGPTDGILLEALRNLNDKTLIGLDTALEELINNQHHIDKRMAEKPLDDM